MTVYVFCATCAQQIPFSFETDKCLSCLQKRDEELTELDQTWDRMMKRGERDDSKRQKEDG